MLHSWMSAGALKLHLPTAAFTHCARARAPDNTLFCDVRNPLRIGFDDMMAYFDLILALFQISPEGNLEAFVHLLACSGR